MFATRGPVRDPVEVVERDLLAEFEDLLPRGTIASIAIEEVRALDGATVRDFVPVVAWRHARRRAMLMVVNDFGFAGA
jgi:hypothetical protein